MKYVLNKVEPGSQFTFYCYNIIDDNLGQVATVWFDLHNTKKWAYFISCSLDHSKLDKLQLFFKIPPSSKAFTLENWSIDLGFSEVTERNYHDVLYSISMTRAVANCVIKLFADEPWEVTTNND